MLCLLLCYLSLLLLVHLLFLLLLELFCLFVFAIFSGWLVGVVSGVGTAFGTVAVGSVCGALVTIFTFGTVAVGTTWVWHLELLKLFVELFELLLPFAVVVTIGPIGTVAVCTFGTVAV